MKFLIAISSFFILITSCQNTISSNSTIDNQFKKANNQYKVLKMIKIGGEGGWDYTAFDTVRRRLYISHSTKVEILDVDKEQLAGDIPNTPGVHGIAFAYDFNKGFTSNGKDSSVTVFDLNTMKIISKIKINGSNPDAILYDPYTKRVFTFNGHSQNSTVISAETGIIEGTIALDGKPEFSVTNGSGKVYVNIEDKSEVQVLNPRTMKVETTWKLDSGEEPSGLAYDPRYKRLFIACGNNTLEIKDAGTGVKIACRKIGKGVDAATFNIATGEIFTSDGEGNLSVIHQVDADHYSQTIKIPTQKGARTMAIDIKKGRIYLPVADFGPPAPAEQGKRQRPSILPGTFGILVVGKDK